MTVQIDLASEKERILKEKAAAAGMSVDAYATRLLDRELTVESAGQTPDEKAEKPPSGSLGAISRMILERVSKLPSEAFDPPRPDGASQHDHYIFGTPKRVDL